MEKDAFSSPLALAGRFSARMKGLLRSRPGPEGSVLLLMPCRSVHTFGMRYPIDIAFVGADGAVVESFRNVTPRRHLECRRAVGVLERFSVPDGSWFKGGDRVLVVHGGGDDS